MPYAKTLIVATLLALGTSAAGAQASGISTGMSGSSAGMISGGGKVASSLDIQASTGPQARKAKPAVRAADNAFASADTDARPRAKAKKKKTYSRNWGFSSFGYSGDRR